MGVWEAGSSSEDEGAGIGGGHAVMSAAALTTAETGELFDETRSNETLDTPPEKPAEKKRKTGSGAASQRNVVVIRAPPGAAFLDGCCS